MSKKYVCIAPHGTCQAKYWNNENGWQKVIDYLVKKDYDVYVISKEGTELKNIIDETGELPIERRIARLKGAEFFIGLSSGMSWLAWGVGTPIFMISGHTDDWYEFRENNRRLYNTDVCHGCWHDSEFDKGDWNWCPRHKNTDRMFECTKSISPSDLIYRIELFLNDNEYYLTNGKLVNLEKEFTKVDLKYKTVWDYPIEYYIFKEIFIDRIYDFNNRIIYPEHVVFNLGPGDIVFDIGANVGIFSRYAQFNKVKEIYSFEPEPTNYESLNKNTLKYNNIMTYNYAVSDTNNGETLYIDSTIGGHSLINKNINNTRTGKHIEVDSITLDKFIEDNSIDVIDFMKIDCEGAEIKVMDGISDENLKKVRKIVLEYHESHYDYNPDTKENFVKRFKDNGFFSNEIFLNRDLVIMYFWR